jgi:heat shock protein HtpX
MDNIKVFVLLAGMVALFGVVGGMLGGQSGMLIALAISAVVSAVMYFNSGKMALKACRAPVVSRERRPSSMKWSTVSDNARDCRCRRWR